MFLLKKLILLYHKIIDCYKNCFKIPNKPELQQITFNYSSDFEDVTNLYKKCVGKPYSFLVNDTTLASDNHYKYNL